MRLRITISFIFVMILLPADAKYGIEKKNWEVISQVGIGKHACGPMAVQV